MTGDSKIGRRSRRAVLAGGVAAGLTVLAGSARSQTVTATSPIPPPVQEPPPDTPAEDATLAAARDEASRLTIEATVNGAGPYRFVVDTASEQTALSEDVATALGLEHSAPVTVSGIARSVTAPTVRVKELVVGPFRHRSLRLPILPRAFMGADGYLGLDIIGNSRVVFDFKNRKLTMERGGRPGYLLIKRPDTARVPVMGKSGLLRATDCFVDGVLADAFIDTGAEVSVANPALRAALEKRHSPLADLGPLSISGVTGGEIIGRIIPITRVEMQDVQFTNFTIVIADVPNFHTWGLADRPALLIGIDFLRQFASVSIDYRQKEFVFTLG